MPSIIINKQTLSFTNIYYVDPVGGVDNVSRSGSKSEPYKTVNWVISNKCAASGDAIFALAGTHDVTNLTTLDSYDAGGLYDQNKAITFIGVPNKTIFLCDTSKHSAPHHHAVQFMAESKAYQIIFDVRYGGKNQAYNQAVFCVSHQNACKGEVHNCVFNMSGMGGAAGITYANSLTSTIKVYNSLFIPVEYGFTASYSGGGGTLVNCATTKVFYTEGTRTTCINNVTLGAKYAITSSGWQNAGTGTDPDGSVADIGIYGGAFKWILLEYKALIKDGNNIYSYIGTVSKIGEGTPTVEMFNTYGADTPPIPELCRAMVNPQLVLLASDPSTTSLKVNTVKKITDVGYLVSMDGNIWYTFLGGKWVVSSDAYGDSMTKPEIEAITAQQWGSLFVAGNLFIKAVLKTDSIYDTPYIDEIKVTLPESYKDGVYYVTTGNGMQLDTRDWRQCNSCDIVQTTPQHPPTSQVFDFNVAAEYTLENSTNTSVADSKFKNSSVTGVSTITEGFNESTFNTNMWTTGAFGAGTVPTISGGKAYCLNGASHGGSCFYKKDLMQPTGVVTIEFDWTYGGHHNTAWWAGVYLRSVASARAASYGNPSSDCIRLDLNPSLILYNNNTSAGTWSNAGSYAANIGVGGEARIKIVLDFTAKTIKVFYAGTERISATLTARDLTSLGNGFTVEFGCYEYSTYYAKFDNISITSTSTMYPTTEGYYALTNNIVELSDVSSITGLSVVQSDTVKTDVRYAVSFDNKSTWKSYVSGAWQTILLSELGTKGMTKSVVEGLTTAQWAGVFSSSGMYLATYIKSVDSNTQAFVDSITVNLPPMDGIRTDIRYAFSNDARTTWKVYKNSSWSTVTLAQLATQGMTMTEVEALTVSDWAKVITQSLDVAMVLISYDKTVTPTIDQITFNYDKLPPSLVTDYIEIPVPDKGFREVLVEGTTYELKMAEGIAFDDSTKDYDFYTTPDKIKMRMVEMGAVIGGKASNVYEVEIINGYETQGFDITLVASQNGEIAKAMGTYGLLNDAPLDESKTKVELSLNGELAFNPIYPLTFRLNPQARRLFYIRVKPTLTTGGDTTFQILLSGRPL